MYKITLTAPPSVNSLYTNVRKVGRVKTPAYKQWQELAMWEMKVRPVVKFIEPVRVVINIGKCTLARDADNFCKSALDFLVKAQVIQNDNLGHVHEVVSRKAFDEVQEGKIRIDVEVM